ncbi:MAG: 1-acyl-sn-glycerol-3-phosphate acyltransferase [Ideonella sp.]|nr:1-acyl-sn-glycerol-3-phosphate acyltransferase [Ideonella sp.]
MGPFTASEAAESPAQPAPPTLARRVRALWRIARSGVHMVYGLLLVTLFFGRSANDGALRMRHAQRWAAGFLRVLGVRVEARGTPRPGAKLIVANHVSWLDILVIDAVVPARFVSKAEVRHWPLFGRLAVAVNTLFIERDRTRDALRVVHQIAEALRAGDTVAVFPEGTTADGRTLLPFHANLLQAAIATATPVQPVALRFADAAHARSPAIEFVGEMTMLQSVWAIACAQGLCAQVEVLPAQSVAHADRRRLAERLREEIGAAIEA